VQLKTHQAKYTKISENFEQEDDKLCTIFESCHIEDFVWYYHKLQAKKDSDEQLCTQTNLMEEKPCSSGSSGNRRYQHHDFDHYYNDHHHTDLKEQRNQDYQCHDGDQCDCCIEYCCEDKNHCKHMDHC